MSRPLLGALALTLSVSLGTASAGAADTLGPVKQIDAGPLSVGYAEAGPADGQPVILLHGWPYDIHSYDEVAPILARQGYHVLVPYARGYGSTRFLSDATPRNGEPAALASDLIAFMDALHIKKATLGGYDWGARTVDITAALWPERVKSLVSVSGYLIASRAANLQPLPPAGEQAWWYQYYFSTERGQLGYEKYRQEFAKLIWKTASPRWTFDEATFDRSAQAFDNPDHAAIVIHNYRWRLSLADGEPAYAPLEAKLETLPAITVPTITLEGDANGAPHPAPEAYAKKFTGPYQFRLLSGGIGHDLPQEAPAAFAQAIVDADHLQ